MLCWGLVPARLAYILKLTLKAQGQWRYIFLALTHYYELLLYGQANKTPQNQVYIYRVCWTMIKCLRGHSLYGLAAVFISAMMALLAEFHDPGILKLIIQRTLWHAIRHWTSKVAMQKTKCQLQMKCSAGYRPLQLWYSHLSSEYSQ